MWDASISLTSHERSYLEYGYSWLLLSTEDFNIAIPWTDLSGHGKGNWWRLYQLSLGSDLLPWKRLAQVCRSYVKVETAEYIRPQEKLFDDWQQYGWLDGHGIIKQYKLPTEYCRWCEQKFQLCDKLWIIQDQHPDARICLRGNHHMSKSIHQLETTDEGSPYRVDAASSQALHHVNPI